MAQRQSVVVLPTIGDPEAKLSPRELELLTDKVRSIIPGILPLKDFNLLKQDAVLERLGAESFFAACKEGSCVGDLVSKVQADFGARVEVISVNKQLYLKFELYGTLRGEKDAGTIDQFNDPVKDFNAMQALLDKKVPIALKRIVQEAAPAPQQQAPSAAPAIGAGVVAQITTEPAGAALEINGIPYPGCTKTPCAVSLYENRFKLSVSLQEYEIADSNVVITMPNQVVNIKLKPIMYRVNFTSRPSGAELSFDDKTRPECTQTPCSVEFPRSQIRVTANLNMYGIEDTTILVSQNNQQVNFALTQAFGTLRINPGYIGELGMDEGWSLTINGKPQTSYENKLSTGRNSVKLAHRCYEDILAHIRIEKDKLETFSMTHGLQPKMDGTVPLCSDPAKYKEKLVTTHSEAIWERCGANTYFNTSKFFCHKDKIISKCGINPQSFNPDLYTCRPDLNPNGIYLKNPVKHGGEDYEAVLVGEQIWLQRNLNSNTSGAACYNNDTLNCSAFGKLFDFETAKTACPSGYYLPTDAEWTALADFAGGSSAAGGKFKSIGFDGTDNYGFSALPGGFNTQGTLSGINDVGYWWSASESGVESVFARQATRKDGVLSKSNMARNSLLSVRCVKYADPKLRKTNFTVNVATQPNGAAIKFDNAVFEECVQTPCKIELKEGKHNITLNFEAYEQLDTIITVMGERFLNIKLPPTFGVLNAENPGYIKGVGKEKGWRFTINDQPASFGKIRFSPGELTVKLTHECYTDIVEKIDIKKGDEIDLSLPQKAKLKQSGVLLNATYKGRNVKEPIFVNGEEITITPYSGFIPLCSELALGRVENKINADLSETKPFEYTHRRSILGSTFFGAALNLAGLVFLGTGIYSNLYIKDYEADYRALGIDANQDDYDKIWKEKEDVKKKRNAFYIVGSVLLVSGIGVHIWF